MVRTIRHQLEKYRTESTGGSFRALPFRDGRLLPHRGWNAERDARGQKTNTSHGFLGTFNRERRVERTGFTPGERFLFLELLACKGGCINGPAKLSHISPALKRYEIIHQSELGNPKDDFKNIDLQILFCKDPHVQDHTYTEEEIKQAMAVVGKTGPEDD